jgi:hypothetical protein
MSSESNGFTAMREIHLQNKALRAMSGAQQKKPRGAWLDSKRRDLEAHAAQ